MDECKFQLKEGDVNYAIIGKGNDYHAMQEFGLALSSYQEALKYPTGEFNALVGLGNVFMDMHSYREALIFYDKELGVNPNELSAHRGMACASNCMPFRQISPRTALAAAMMANRAFESSLQPVSRSHRMIWPLCHCRQRQFQRGRRSYRYTGSGSLCL